MKEDINTKYKYKSVFASRIQTISNSELDKYISLAGLEKLTPILPKDVDLKNNPDLIGIVGNLCAAGIMNKNMDAISNETAINIAKSFIWKYVNANHRKNIIIGTICNSGFSKFGSNEILTEEEAKKETNPINISIAVLLYKSVLSDKFIELLEESVDENSVNHNSLSFSWELLFANYDIGIGSKYVSEAKIITDNDEKIKYEKYLPSNGGNGKNENGEYVYRLINSDFSIGLGAGIVENPASAVKGLKIIENNENIEENNASAATQNNDIPTLNSQNEKNDVTNIRDKTEENNKNITMATKITKISDLTDEVLKESKASAVIELINSELEKANEQWKIQVSAKDDEVKTINTKLSEAKEKADKAEKDLSELTVKFETLNNKVVAQEKEQTFNARMSYFDSEYELDKEYREIIASDIKDLDEDGFKKYQTKASVLFKGINKKAIAEAKEKAENLAKEKEEAEKNKNLKTSNASDTTATDTKIEDALKDGKKTTANLPNTTSLGENLYDEYKKAFAIDQCVVKVSR